MLMRPDDGGINDQIFEVRIIGHRLEDPPPNTLNTLFQSPNASGRSRQEEPVRTIHSTPSTNIRLSRPVEPFWSGRPIISGAIRSHAASLAEKARWDKKKNWRLRCGARAGG
jgi:hypothetical protein